jgi:S-adenosylmethionine:tRNA ribosyltransferase-isomerase
MDTSELDYELPEAAIAQTPIEPRDAARMLTYLSGSVQHLSVADLTSVLRRGDLLVVNDTRVIPARLHVQKSTGGLAEVMLLERHDETGVWRALVRPGRKLPIGTVLGRPDTRLRIEIMNVVEDGQRLVRIGTLDQPVLSLRDESLLLAEFGEAPLPPYITARLPDADRYQTVYANQPGSVAAPTAGLHFTPELFAALDELGVARATVELVVGLDTFRPVATQRVEDHVIHTERYAVPAETWRKVVETRQRGGRVVAVGTTSVRSLESVGATGMLSGRTNLFIRDGHPWAAVDLLLTNFHMPRTTLLALVRAFVGPVWRDLYGAALADGYRFLSFGDCMLLERGVPIE